jgi:hypothetical protein
MVADSLTSNGAHIPAGDSGFDPHNSIPADLTALAK